MRQLTIYVDHGKGDDVVDVARKHKALEITRWEAVSQSGKTEVVSIQVTNRSLGDLLKDLDQYADLTISFLPHDVITFMPPSSSVPSQVANLEPRSPLEVYLHSLQSLGDWHSFLAYAIAGAIVLWIAFFTNSIFLLLAAMLIAPFAEPAMNVALATALGDRSIFVDNLLRYLFAILSTALVAGLLAVIFQENLTTGLMVSVSQVSSVAFLLPLVAGTAGALNLVQPKRSNLVTGAAAGVLVAAALAPPAGLLGIAISMGLWNMAFGAGFQLALQLVGINLAGSIVFRIYGLSPDLARYSPGKKSIFYLSLAGTLLALAGLLFWQNSSSLRLERSSQDARAAQIVQQVIVESGLAEPIQIETSFPDPDPSGSHIMLVTGYVRPDPDVNQTADSILGQLKPIIARRLRQANPEITPMIDLTVLERIPPKHPDTTGELRNSY